MIEAVSPGEYPVEYFFISAGAYGGEEGSKPEDAFHPEFRLGIKVGQKDTLVRLRSAVLEIQSLPKGSFPTVAITNNGFMVGLPREDAVRMVLCEEGWDACDYYAAWKPQLPQENPVTVTLSRKDLSEINWSWQYREVIDAELPVYTGFQVVNTTPNPVSTPV